MAPAAAPVVVVGAGAGGDAAVDSIRAAGYAGRLVLVGADPHSAYERPLLSKGFLRGEVAMERVFLRPSDSYAGLDIEWIGGHAAVAADRRRSTITLDDGRRLRFHRLVLATGGAPRALPGAPPADNVFMLRTLDDAIALRAALGGVERLLVVGAGFIGAEVAASMRAQGHEVLLVEAAPVPLGHALGERVGAVFAAVHRRHGVDLRTGCGIRSWTVRAGRVGAVELTTGKREAVDAVLVAVGLAPNLEIARQLGLPLGSGGVFVDASLQAAPDIACVGDIAAHLHPVYNRRVRAEHWQVARHQGRWLGPGLVGGPRPYTELPWFWSEQYDVRIEMVGHVSGFEQAVWRGEGDRPPFAVFYLAGGLIDAVLAVGEPKAIRFGRELIAGRRPVAAERLASPATDLRELARSPA